MARSGALARTTGKPEQSRCRPPRQDALEVAVEPRLAPRRHNREHEAADLHATNGDGKRSPRSPNASGKATAMIKEATMMPISTSALAAGPDRTNW